MPNFTGICVVCGRPMQVGTTSADPARRKHNECRPHGVARYKKDGCRCAVCKDAKSAEAAAYRARRIGRTGLDPSTESRRAMRGGAPVIPDCVVCERPLKASPRAGDPMHKECRPRPSFYVAPKTRLEIYERDAWVCQLCFYPVDRTAHYQSAWAASLDHIVPRSLASAPDHSPAALRTAHRFCNALRGNGRHVSMEKLRARVDELMGVS